MCESMTYNQARQTLLALAPVAIVDRFLAEAWSPQGQQGIISRDFQDNLKTLVADPPPAADPLTANVLLENARLTAAAAAMPDDPSMDPPEWDWAAISAGPPTTNEAAGPVTLNVDDDGFLTTNATDYAIACRQAGLAARQQCRRQPRLARQSAQQASSLDDDNSMDPPVINWSELARSRR